MGKSIGKKKAEQLAASHPGITLSSWLDINYKHVVLEQRISEGGKTLVVPRHNVDLTIGLLSTDNINDWIHLATTFVPAGTILDRVPESFYDLKILQLRQVLTRKLLEEPNNQTAKRYMDILERRDPTRWGQHRPGGVKISTKATTEVGDEAEKTNQISLEFEIVDP